MDLRELKGVCVLVLSLHIPALNLVLLDSIAKNRTQLFGGFLLKTPTRVHPD